MRVAVTGATGLVGQALVLALSARGYLPRAIVRAADRVFNPSNFETVTVSGIDSQTDWAAAFSAVECVVHCAGLTHLTRDIEPDSLQAYRTTNTEGTSRLAENAVECGVKRLIFLSSIKVNGEQTSKGVLLNASDTPNPEYPYGISKWEAEQALFEISLRTGLEVVIIRPPLVYGPWVKGNFLIMLKWLYSGIPMPLGAVENKRSLVGIDNLVDLIIKCTDHPAAANQTFLVSDGQDLSTTDLLLNLGVALRKPARLFPVPTSLLWNTSQLIGKKAFATSLLGNLQVDISKTRELLDWNPAISFNEGFQKTADWYLSQR
jgi:nucleoside-diphosphate-sugar epimerase